jgi:hypothetical protein
MKNLPVIILSIVLTSHGLLAGRTVAPQQGLYIQVKIEHSEHSKDSNSETETLTVSGDTLIYEDSHRGAHSGRFKPVEKRYKLSEEDRDGLARLLNEKRLLTTKNISKDAPAGSHVFYWLELSLQSKLGGKEGLISIYGPLRSSEIKGDRLYQKVLPLVEALYRIMNRTDADMSFQGFDDDEPKE